MAPVTNHQSRLSSVPYRAPWWLPGGHAQTIYAAQLAPRPRVAFRRERWNTPDGDFIDLDWVEDPESGGKEQGDPPLVALFHGLEGSSRSHYALALMSAVRGADWRGVVVHFRGCGGEPNRLARAYHSGDSAEIDWIVRRLCGQAAALFAAGVSLGGNALLKWLGETGAAASTVVNRAVAVSSPVDLMAAGEALGQGVGLFYARHFLATLRPKALAKLSDHPGLFDAARVHAARTLREFDDCVTAPLHGFRDTDDYWTRASSKRGLRNIQVPTLVLNAKNDPFLPAHALPHAGDVSGAVILEQPDEGGHAGFISGPFPGNLGWLPRRVLGFFSERR